MQTETGREEYTGNGGDHILACLSASPSSLHVLEEAAAVAAGRAAILTALYVHQASRRKLSGEEERQLNANLERARELGARVVRLEGTDVPYEIARYARISGVTRIVIGQSPTLLRNPFARTLTDRVLSYAPGMDIYIIPDAGAKPRREERQERFRPTLGDMLRCVLVFTVCILVSEVFRRMHFSEANIIMVFIMATVINCVITHHRIYGLVSSLLGIFLFNYLFTEPRFTLFVYETGYQSTFLIMFSVAFIIGSLAERLRKKAEESADAAYRTQILLDTNVLLEKVRGEDAILEAGMGQLEKILGTRPVYLPGRAERSGQDPALAWFPMEVRGQYLGTVGISQEERELDARERNLIQAVLGECALALENDRNRKAREEAELKVRSEALRANLLRTISHDIRTPLTSISGHAANLMEEENKIDPALRRELYRDIYEESRWLIELVENLLSISRIVDGAMQLQLQPEDIGDLMEESVHHLSVRAREYEITVLPPEDLVLVRADARLILQVLINLVNNAVQHTPPGTKIQISCRRRGGEAEVSVSDNGPGIPDESKEKVFELFYSLNNPDGDSIRSTGLGLGLCRSITEAHGGKIRLQDNIPAGCIFTFTLPAVEVEIDEET